MKYGESAFDIIYLAFALVCGAIMLKKAHTRTGRLMGVSAIVLGLGDAFHLVPRVLNYFTEADLTAWLGIGKLVTSVTMTAFYVLLYYVCLGFYGREEKKPVTCAVWALAVVRTALCLFPQNGWLTNESPLLWSVLRNIPFIALGALLIVLWFRPRLTRERLRLTWLWMLLSFAFYIPVALFAGLWPMLGMLMLPKTVCYMIMLWTFTRYVTEES
ncbi:MAG: hypothetical protein IKG85_01040 [Clostridia bacterium]|nr:hypothetical protein [Clostridia bacterium]